jgi:hypothetical protein
MHPSFRYPLMAIALVLGAAGLHAWLGGPDAEGRAHAVAADATPAVTLLPLGPSAAAPAQPALSAATPAVPPAPRQTVPVIAGAEPSETVVFQLTPEGQIVTDEAARLAIEKLFALNEAAERDRKLRLLQDSLPPAAARELGELMARYDAYQEAQYQTLPPGVELRSVPEALAQLDRLQQLRQQYFGLTVAAGFFGEETKQQRELLLQMALDTSAGGSLEEKAARALRPGG